MIAIVTGLPGSGKTTFAVALARQLNALHLNTDRIRMAMGLKGQYDDMSRQKVYDELFRKTAEAIANGEDVIVDGTFYSNEWRRQFERMAKQEQVVLRWIVIKAQEPTIRERLQQKRAYSEADFEVYCKIQRIWEAFDTGHLVLWSDEMSLDEMIIKGKEYLQLLPGNSRVS